MNGDIERGYCVCRDGRLLLKEKTIPGEASSIQIPVKCSRGQPAALVHSHTSGNINPSSQDLQTSKRLGIPVCVRTKHGIRCYKAV
jgi:proteasome lid subunit RPN8/RPN11